MSRWRNRPAPPLADNPATVVQKCEIDVETQSAMNSVVVTAQSAESMKIIQPDIKLGRLLEQHYGVHDMHLV